MVAELADGDAVAAVVVGEQAEGFVDGEVARGWASSSRLVWRLLSRSITASLGASVSLTKA